MVVDAAVHEHVAKGLVVPADLYHHVVSLLALLSKLLGSSCLTHVGREAAADEKVRGQKVAWHQGCPACCKNAAVPILPAEVRAISWLVCEEMDSETQERLRPRLLNAQDSLECSFLRAPDQRDHLDRKSLIT